MSNIARLPEPLKTDCTLDALRDMTDTINKLIETLDWLEYNLETRIDRLEENR